MNSKQLHGPDCNCSQCTLGEQEEMIVDLTSTVATDEVFALNEKSHLSCQKLFKTREEMLNRTDYCESNDGDSDLIIYIPFSYQVNIRSMRIIGGENGMTPGKIKIFVNKKESDIDFDLKEAKAEQEQLCEENPDGAMSYPLKANKFHSVWSITIVVMYNNGADNTRIYYIGFEGANTKKRKTFKLQIPEDSVNTTKITPTKEEHIHDHLIYG
jgi:hypothetical protein